MTSNGIEDRLLTPEDAAGYLGYAVGTVYNKISRGELPYVKLGHSVRLRLSELNKWIEQRNAESRPAGDTPARATA